MPDPIPTIHYNVQNWYWRVGDKSPGSQVYSSHAGNYVALSNAAYLAWLVNGGVATKIDAEQNLADLLALSGQPLPSGATSSSAVKDEQFSDIQMAILKWAFAIENRVRVLEGQSTRTLAQFKNYIEGML